MDGVFVQSRFLCGAAVIRDMQCFAYNSEALLTLSFSAGLGFCTHVGHKCMQTTWSDAFLACLPRPDSFIFKMAALPLPLLLSLSRQDQAKDPVLLCFVT